MREQLVLYSGAHLSRVAARMYLPFGENFTNETGGLSSSACTSAESMQCAHIRSSAAQVKKARATDERLEALAGGGVPNAHEAVVAARHDERAVAVEVHGTHGVRVRRQSSQALARLHVPNAHRLVELKGLIAI